MKLGAGKDEERGGPGYVHLPLVDWADDELADQLTSERLVMTWSRGIPKATWTKTRMWMRPTSRRSRWCSTEYRAL